MAKTKKRPFPGKIIDLRTPFRPLSKKRTPGLGGRRFLTWGFILFRNSTGQTNRSQVDYFAIGPPILGFASSGAKPLAAIPAETQAQEQNQPTDPTPARKGNNTVTNTRAYAAFLDTRVTDTRIRISTPHAGVLIYVYKHYKQGNRCMQHVYGPSDSNARTPRHATRQTRALAAKRVQRASRIIAMPRRNKQRKRSRRPKTEGRI